MTLPTLVREHLEQRLGTDHTPPLDDLLLVILRARLGGQKRPCDWTARELVAMAGHPLALHRAQDVVDDGALPCTRSRRASSEVVAPMIKGKTK
jgi:hypothetical protein